MTVRTAISEIAGSESFVHVEFADTRWVMLAPGIHDIEPDAAITVYVDTRHLMAFAPDGRAIAGPAAASLAIAAGGRLEHALIGACLVVLASVYLLAGPAYTRIHR